MNLRLYKELHRLKNILVMFWSFTVDCVPLQAEGCE